MTLTQATISQLGDALNRRAVSVRDIVTEVLDLAEQRADLNAFISLQRDEALQVAAALDKELRKGYSRGPLHGVPVCVKDCIDVAGVWTTAGSPVLQDNIALTDAHVVFRLRRAGAVVFGKANMYEFGYGLPNKRFGYTKNPLNVAYACGGTSSGCAAAVAAGIGPASIGTDAGGSVRIPAAFCGLAGFKPSFGSVGRTGVLLGSYSLDTLGSLARCVDDAALVVQALRGIDPRDVHPAASLHVNAGADVDLRDRRLAILDLDAIPEVDQSLRVGFRRVCAALTSAGAQLEAVDLPSADDLRLIMYTIFSAEAAEIHRERMTASPTAYGATLASLLTTGSGIGASDYLRCQRLRQELGAGIDRLFDTNDALVMPTVPFPSYPVAHLEQAIDGESVRDELEHVLTQKTRFTVPFNLSGGPAVALPFGRAKNGIPFSLQVAGRFGADEQILGIARAIETLLSDT